MNSIPLVTVIIPCFNAEKFIDIAINSVLCQTYKNIEIIVIDDGSSDNTLGVLKRYANDELVSLLTHPNNENQGVGFTRRLGIDAAKGEYLAFLDADDYFESTKIEVQVALLEKNMDVVLCHTAINLITDVDANEDFEEWFNYTDVPTTYNLQDTDIYLKSNNISNSSVVIRTQIIKQINFESKQLFQFEDWVTWTLASEYGTFIFTPQRLTNYRFHDASATSKVLKNRLKLSFSFLEFYLTLLTKTFNSNIKTQCISHINEMLNEMYCEYANNREEAATHLPFNTLTQLQQLISDLRHENLDQKQSLSLIAQQVAERDQQLAEMTQQLAERSCQLSESERRIEALHNSLCWKITAPLRVAARPLMRNVRQLLPTNLSEPTTVQYQIKEKYPPRGKRPRIVHALANFMTGGSSRLVVDLVEHHGHIYEQEVLTSYNPDPPNYVGIKVHEFPALTSPDKVKAYFENFRPDLVHIHYWGESDKIWYEQVFKAAEDCGCKVLQNVNTPVEPYFSDSINHYAYVSEYVYHTFGRQDSRSSVIYPGSNFNIFTRSADAAPIQDDCIGMVYRLESDKLNEAAIDVFIEVVKRRPGTKALIVGGGTFLEPYKKAVHDAGVMDSFEFTGYVPYEDLPLLYEQMSIFVAPVWKESFGQVSPFAMNMDLPVVGYDIGALSEIIGTKELLAPLGNSKRLAEIIIDLLDDREKRLSIGRLNRDRAQQLFSIDVMVESYQKLYTELTT